ncbi:MAG: hypothetical protein E7394_01950 [Ruminococcaceae bacterium]|nr:hypothetical protein [Oscillospiraceae bacterium]
MDIQVRGSEYGLDIKEYIQKLAEITGEFSDYVKILFSAGMKFRREELSVLLSMLIQCKHELIKLKSRITGFMHRDTLNNLIISIEKVIRHKFFEGIYIHQGIVDKNAIVTASRHILRIYRKYQTLMKIINQCILRFCVFSDRNCVTWADSQVLVGALRNRQQLEIALNNKFYHIPKHMIPDDKVNISYIAIYQSKNLFGNHSGIKYFGKVLSSEVVKRKEISEIPSESEELYVRYNVDEWNKLGNNISSGYGGTLVGFTNLYMMLRADITDELYFTDESEYKLYRSIKVSIQKGYDKVATSYNGYVIAISKGNISVYKDNRLIYNISINEFLRNPVGRFNSIANVCKNISTTNSM